MKKIMIIGSPGTGKSTLGRQLEDKLSIKLYHLDKLFWKPHWEMSTKHEQQTILSDIVEKDSWIIDGNYSSTLDIRMKQADTIIYLKKVRLVCLYQVLKRVIKYRGTTRPDMQEDCPEKIDIEFIKWIWHFPKNHEPLIEEQMNQLNKSQVLVTLTSKKEVKQFLKRMEYVQE
ncbi:DNA topology modulation protein [Vagococcus teuberi]